MKAFIILIGLNFIACSKAGFFSEEKKKKVQNENTDSPGETTGIDGGNEDGSTTDNGTVDGGTADGGAVDGGAVDGGTSDGGTDGGHQCESEEEIIDLCANSNLIVHQQRLFYEERKECSFAKGSQLALTTHYEDTCNYSGKGNLCAKQAHLQAQAIQSKSIELPKNAVLCSLEVESSSQKIQYDDFLIFTLDDYLLMLSNDELLRKMPKKDGLYIWSFEKIKGKRYGFEGNRHCLGDDSSCMLPGHDQPGPVNFSVDTESLAKLSQKMQGKEAYRFDVIATGDNDWGDCWHTDLNLKVKIKYAIKPE
ncbi:MAG: hypothetical protein AB8G05_14760 [Oligoflexales bacterium]